MKKTLFILWITTTFSIVQSMKLVRKLSGKSTTSSHEMCYDNHSVQKIIEEACKTTTIPSLLRITYQAYDNFKLTPLEIAEYTIERDKLKNDHKQLYIAMIRIAHYHETLKNEQRLCPILELGQHYEHCIELYQEHKKHQIFINKHLGLTTLPSVAPTTITYPIQIDPKIDFEAFLQLEKHILNIYNRPYNLDSIFSLIHSQYTTHTKNNAYVTLEND